MAADWLPRLHNKAHASRSNRIQAEWQAVNALFASHFLEGISGGERAQGKAKEKEGVSQAGIFQRSESKLAFGLRDSAKDTLNS